MRCRRCKTLVAHESSRLPAPWRGVRHTESDAPLQCRDPETVAARAALALGFPGRSKSIGLLSPQGRKSSCPRQRHRYCLAKTKLPTRCFRRDFSCDSGSPACTHQNPVGAASADVQLPRFSWRKSNAECLRAMRELPAQIVSRFLPIAVRTDGSHNRVSHN